MKTMHHSADKRGSMDYGWLKANFSFSFGSYYNPEKIHFGKLRVLNDDVISGGMGFATHGHENMEIITIPLKGALKHKDSTGQEGVIRPNEIQVMSAGSGIEHSEMNFLKNDDTSVLQLWIFPRETHTEPTYQQQYFEPVQRQNKWMPIVSPVHQGALEIKQDAVLSLTDLEAGKSVDYEFSYSGNGLYLYVISGAVKIDDKLLSEKDALEITETESFTMEASSDAYVLAVEVPMN